MKVFLTKATAFLSNDFEIDDYVLEKFCEGNLYLRVNPEIKDKDVFIIANTQAPAENILELVFLLDALSRLNNKICLFFTYFAYARQDRIVKEGEALSAEVISKIFRLFDIKKIYILHPHSDNLIRYLDSKPIIPYNFFNEIAKNYDVIISPDKGGIPVAKNIAYFNNCEFNYFEKERTHPDAVEIHKLQLNHEFDVKNKSILIVDDMIATGSTVIKSARILMEKGAKSVSVAATHAVLCEGSKTKLQNSVIEEIYVTNSIEQASLPSKFKVYSIAPLLQDLILANSAVRR